MIPCPAYRVLITAITNKYCLFVAAQSQLTAASLSGYEAAAAANYATAAAAGFAGIPAAYTYGVPQQTLGLTSPATAATHFQAQQLQERLQ